MANRNAHPRLVGERSTMRKPRAAIACLAMFAVGPTKAGATDGKDPRHLIYLHGRIVQEQQSPRPRDDRFGYYELEKILDVFRNRGFVVSGGIRPKSASVSESADRVVGQVRRLLESGVQADHITVVGASMGASIALLASARLQNAGVRFAALGACLSQSVPTLLSEEGKAPSGHLLAIREASDDLSGPCQPWKAEANARSSLVAREVVLNTGQPRIPVSTSAGMVGSGHRVGEGALSLRPQRRVPGLQR